MDDQIVDLNENAAGVWMNGSNSPRAPDSSCLIEVTSSLDDMCVKPTNSNLDSTEIDADIIKKLRGDAIGDTSFSATFVTKTLLQLANLNWTEELEGDLCSLWDMTMEKDVCEYLLTISYPSIAFTVINAHDISRLIEILVGILANISSVLQRIDVNDEELGIIFSLLGTDDTLVLIQVMRFIGTISFRLDIIPLVDEYVIDKLSYIVANSTNISLIIYTLHAIVRLTTNAKIDAALITSELVKASLVGYKFVYYSVQLSEFDEQTTEQKSALKYFVQFISNICDRIDPYVNDVFLEDVNKAFDTVMEDLIRMFNFIKLEPLNHAIIQCAEALLVILDTLSVDYDSTLFCTLMGTTFVLLQTCCKYANLFINLDKYFILAGDINELKRDLSRLKKEEVVPILNRLPRNDADLVEKLNILLHELD